MAQEQGSTGPFRFVWLRRPPVDRAFERADVRRVVLVDSPANGALIGLACAVGGVAIASASTRSVPSGSPECQETRASRVCSFQIFVPKGPVDLWCYFYDVDPNPDNWRQAADSQLHAGGLVGMVSQRTTIRGSADLITFASEPTLMARLLNPSGLRSPTMFAALLATGFSVVAAVIIAMTLRLRWQAAPIAMCVIGFLVPALAGAALKLWLQVQGRPTAPWGVFLMYPPIGVIISAPAGGLALLTRICLSRALDDQARSTWSWLLGGAMVGTVASMTLTFVDVFSSPHWDDVVVFSPLLWPSYLPGALLGAAAGWVIRRATTMGRWTESPA